MSVEHDRFLAARTGLPTPGLPSGEPFGVPVFTGMTVVVQRSPFGGMTVVVS